MDRRGAEEILHKRTGLTKRAGGIFQGGTWPKRGRLTFIGVLR